MSLNGLMRTSTSGMAAQSSRLNTVADNIANTDTIGYKRASTEFSSLVLDTSKSSHVSGGVQTHVRHGISQQGTLQSTSSATDAAVNGQGFFIVSGSNSQTVLTRAGSFIVNGDGELVNAAGYSLMGLDVQNGDPGLVANSFAGLEVINVRDLAMVANPSISGTLSVNLPAGATTVAAADLPSTNSATAAYTAKTSLSAFDNLGSEVILDIYSSKSASETWEVTVFDRSTAAASGSFPYASGPLATTVLTFDPTTGALASASPTSVSIPVPNGKTALLDMSETSQLGGDYATLTANINGDGPQEVDSIEITDGGYIVAVYENGLRTQTHRIPLADVASPDNLKSLSGNVFALTDESGQQLVRFAGTGGMGRIVSGALEKSTVDLADELTTMIESQRNYTANSKVFQTGSELLDVLINLKR